MEDCEQNKDHEETKLNTFRSDSEVASQTLIGSSHNLSLQRKDCVTGQKNVYVRGICSLHADISPFIFR